MSGRTLKEQHRQVVERFRKANGERPASAEEMAQWAVDNGLIKPHPKAFVKQCAEALATAMREEYYADPQGRSVRTKHAARNGQTTLWDDIRTANPQHMTMAFAQRRQQIVGDCRQLKTDADSFNENAHPSRPIQVILDFTEDVAEMQAASSRSHAFYGVAIQ